MSLKYSDLTNEELARKVAELQDNAKYHNRRLRAVEREIEEYDSLIEQHNSVLGQIRTREKKLMDETDAIRSEHEIKVTDKEAVLNKLNDENNVKSNKLASLKETEERLRNRSERYYSERKRHEAEAIKIASECQAYKTYCNFMEIFTETKVKKYQRFDEVEMGLIGLLYAKSNYSDLDFVQCLCDINKRRTPDVYVTRKALQDKISAMRRTPHQTHPE